MAAKYKTPGIYVKEISKFPPAIVQVETAIPAFIGYTEKADKNGESLLNEPIRINSLLEYETYFGNAKNEQNITVTINDDINSRSPVQILNQNFKIVIGMPSPYIMYYSMCMYFDNGGGPCYIVSVGDYTSGVVNQSLLAAAVDKLENYDEPTLYVFPDAIAVATASSYYSLINRALMQAQKLKDRFIIIDTYGNNSDTIRNTATLGNGTDLLKYGAAYHPFLKTVYSFRYDDADVHLIHNQTNDINTTTAGAYNGKVLSELSDSNEANFNLTLYNKITAELEQQYVILPPSSAVAGVYARVDRNRGVWKAPANESISAVIEPTIKITNEVQKDLNIHSSGKSINAIRSFTGKGILIWGARTLAGNDNEWRYINVRRFFNMIEESVDKALIRFVFEPNEANTWVKVRAMTENFLTIQWRAGALSGAKPEQAFYVRVGLGETMTANDIVNGRMIVEIGMAAIRPAEFIILKLSYKMQQA